MAVLHFFLLNSPLIYILFSLDFVLKVDTVECDPTVQGLLMKKKPSTLMVGMLAIEIKICSFTNEKVILTILEHWLTVWPPTTLQYAYKNVIAKVKTYEVKKNRRSVLGKSLLKLIITNKPPASLNLVGLTTTIGSTSENLTKCL